jgi:putative MATE family efflux protein
MASVDLTTRSIPAALIRLALPILFGMIMFTLYLLADLYFVGRLGPDAVAALSISGNAFFIHLGFSTVLGTGAMALIAQACGRKDFTYAGAVFKQSILLTVLVGVVAAGIGWLSARRFISFVGGTDQALVWGVQYFQIFSISFIFLLLLYVIGSGYRGMGNTKTPFFVMLQANLLNIALDPILIFGLMGAPRLEVRGAAIASLISQLYAIGAFGFLIRHRPFLLDLTGSWRPRLDIIRQSLIIGLPSGLSHFLLAANLMITYRVASPYGTAALAAIGIGWRILNAIYLPVIALSSATAAMVGQNFGAGKPLRVKQTFRLSASITVLYMFGCTALCWLVPAELVGVFTRDSEVLAYGRQYLTIFTLSNAFVGMIMVMGAAFQGLGKTYPSLAGAIIDNIIFAALVFSLPIIFGWGIVSIWWIKVTATIFETALVALWLKRDLGRISTGELAATRPSRPFAAATEKRSDT